MRAPASELCRADTSAYTASPRDVKSGEVHVHAGYINAAALMENRRCCSKGLISFKSSWRCVKV
ncbi:hypothetical protein EYF80_009777 [Liparis tanakae]|uniref:Uncharacterized protein n=1 Tax=Liparis tanakae TaxID=230148 RepID=A0A4Z2IPL6_9TELE|nr:hypothetical protein EYF80_009777 [Liparis tanakae]